MLRKTLTILSLIGLLLIFGAGCQVPIRHLTPSGQEITIKRRVGAQVAEWISNRMVQHYGYSVKNATKTLMVFEKRGFTSWTKLRSGNYDHEKTSRLTYTIVETQVSTRVVASWSVIKNPGLANERVYSMNDSEASLNIQKFLTRLKNAFEDPMTAAPHDGI